MALHFCRASPAQRCLYGVDKNPLATDLAKLSLWLATLARDHEFTFLDHALKSGDSLVGLTQGQIAAANWDGSKPGLPLFRKLVADRIQEAMRGRAEIQEAPDDVARIIQEARHRALDSRLADIRTIGDATIAAFFSSDKQRTRERVRQEIESLLSGMLDDTGWKRLREIAASLQMGPHPLLPFHWEIEFPEVFGPDNSGFDAIVGNPPFAGKNTTIAGNRVNYLPWLQTLHEGTHGNADLVAHFFRRAFGLLRKGGVFGLIATNTIRQGDTRASGLTAICQNGGAILRATRRLKWPGEAAVVVSVVHIAKGAALSPVLDGRQVRRISAYLVEGDYDATPTLLRANQRKCFQGTNLVGIGFTFDDANHSKGLTSSLAEMSSLLSKNPRNQERIKPYIGGEELNTDPRHAHRRYAIDFDGMTREEAESGWPDLFEIVRRLVKPSRDRDNREHRRSNWWLHGERQTGLYKAIERLPRVLAAAQVSPMLSFTFLPRGMIYSHKTIIFAFSSFSPFAVLQSRVHETWARLLSSTMKDDLSYAPSDCFSNFSPPPSLETLIALETAGQAYHDHRAALMVARNEGMTKTYNRFHDPTETAEDIQHLRELHAAMDRAVLEAYGWHDLAARAEAIFLDKTSKDDHTYQGRLFWPLDFRDEVLAGLLALNAERHAEEVCLGIAPGMKGKVRGEEDDEVEDESDAG